MPEWAILAAYLVSTRAGYLFYLGWNYDWEDLRREWNRSPQVCFTFLLLEGAILFEFAWRTFEISFKSFLFPIEMGQKAKHKYLTFKKRNEVPKLEAGQISEVEDIFGGLSFSYVTMRQKVDLDSIKDVQKALQLDSDYTLGGTVGLGIDSEDESLPLTRPDAIGRYARWIQDLRKAGL